MIYFKRNDQVIPFPKEINVASSGNISVKSHLDSCTVSGSDVPLAKCVLMIQEEMVFISFIKSSRLKKCENVFS